MNNEIAGNIMSLVNGFEDILAAVAKELNATSTARHPTRSDSNLCDLGGTYMECQPKVLCSLPVFESSDFNRRGRVGGQTRTEQIPIFLSILSSSSLRTNNTRRRNACSQAYNLILNPGEARSTPRHIVLIGRTGYTVPPDIRQQFAHQARTLVLALHLLYLKVLHEICDHGIQRNGKDHDANSYERGPPEKVVQ